MTPGQEDLKIITLARSTRARVAASEGAAVRDETGRTYTAAAVALPSLRLSALRLAVAMAVSSGAEKLEAAALVSEAEHGPRRPGRGPRPRAGRGGVPRRPGRHHPPGATSLDRHASRTGAAGTPSLSSLSTRSLSPKGTIVSLVARSSPAVHQRCPVMTERSSASCPSVSTRGSATRTRK